MDVDKFSKTHLAEIHGAKHIGVSVLTLRMHNAKGDIRSSKIGHTRFYSLKDLHSFMERFGAGIRARQKRLAESKATRNAITRVLLRGADSLSEVQANGN